MSNDMQRPVDGPDRPLGAATYTFLYEGSLEQALRSLAEEGIGMIELTVAPPHVDGCTMPTEDCRRLRRVLRELGLHAVSLNPTYLDLNLVSLNTRFRQESTRQLEEALRLCHDLEIGMLVLFAGRRHPLAPAPRALVEPVLLEQLAHLCDVAEPLGVTIGLENGPTLVLDRGAEVADACRALGRRGLRAVIDVANAQMVEEPARALAAAAPYLALVHLSDTTRARWAHAPIGEGDVDFGAVAAVLESLGYRGPSIMEIVDLACPLQAMVTSAALLARLGWGTISPMPVSLPGATGASADGPMTHAESARRT
ncbi:MAG: sugar phosphate isomerase/epimerase [Actinomycetota bacterium]|nr:sugar phosphate isomerase/epimerase [Actinomycetota bacterium]